MTMATLSERCTPDARLLEVFEKVTEALDQYCEWEREWISNEDLDRESIMAIEEDLGCTKRNIADLIADKLVLLS
jgi:hypothetical protein